MLWLENVVLIKENIILFESLFKTKTFNCFKKVSLSKKWHGIHKKIIFKIINLITVPSHAYDKMIKRKQRVKLYDKMQ